MTLGFDLGIPTLARQCVAPWWHSYRAPDGTLPDLIYDGATGRLHGAQFLNDWTIDLSAINLDGGFTVHAKGSIDYTLGGNEYPRLIEITADRDAALRQTIVIAEPDGIVRMESWHGSIDARQAVLVLSIGAQPSGASFTVTGRFQADNFAGSLNHQSVLTDNYGTLPTGLDRLFLLSFDGNHSLASQIDTVVLWASGLSNDALENYGS